MAGAAMAQVVARDESALVYYSPKTDVVLNFNYTVERQEAGIYAQYAESMLGVKEWVKETRTTHRLNDVRITTHTSTDYSRPHKVSADAGIPMLLNINAKGLLVGYNVPLDKSEKKAFPKHPQEKAKEAAQLAVPYLENVLKAATPLAQAHAVAQQIMHIREPFVRQRPSAWCLTRQKLRRRCGSSRKRTDLPTQRTSMRIPFVYRSKCTRNAISLLRRTR